MFQFVRDGRGAEAHLSLPGSEQPLHLPAQPLWPSWSRLKARFGNAEHLLHRATGAMFVVRVAAAVLAYVSQVLFARWMGSFEFGIYVYVWTWVLLIGQALDLGLATAAQRFIPEYRERKLFDHLRGFIFASRALTIGIAAAIAALCGGVVYLLQPWLDEYTVIPLYIACISLPAYALATTQDGIARSYYWVGLSILPTYVIRQLILTALMGGAFAFGLGTDATTALILAAAAIWFSTLSQGFILNRRLAERIEPGPKVFEVKHWLVTATPILMAEGFYLLLAHTDILVLQQFNSPEDVAVYYAAVKTLALVSFIYWAVRATAAHRFSELHVTGNREGLAQFLAQSIRWTFWPSLAATALLLAFGRPILGLFGPQFTDGYPLMFILAAGLMARATVGPVERLLNMLGEQRICALVYALAFAVNLGLCFLLIPRFGTVGAATSIAAALIAESLLLFAVTKHRLGFHVFIWGAARRPALPQ